MPEQHTIDIAGGAPAVAGICREREIRNEVWRAPLQELVSGASFIVIQLTGLTAGVLSELQTILRHHKEKV